MSSTTMHFGPEWMRPKQQSVSRTQPPPSPPPAAIPQTPNASSYSALVSPAPPVNPGKEDEAHPFRYSKEEMLRIYKESGKGGLGLEVERWEGVVREIGSDPLFSASLNSDLRRRQSNDYLNLNTQNLERPRLPHSNTSGTGSPLRERFGALGMQRRRDSTDQAPNITPRRLSLSGQAPLGSPRDVGLPSPRRLGHTPSFDGVLNGGDSWVARRRASEAGKVSGTNREPSGGEENEILEEEEERQGERQPQVDVRDNPVPPSQPNLSVNASGLAFERPQDLDHSFSSLSVGPKSQPLLHSPNPHQSAPAVPQVDLNSVEWSYLDPQGQTQGPFRADVMQKWSDDGYFTPDLLMKRTSIDTDWITVAELTRRTGGGKMFLTPILQSGPPGLARRTDSPFGLVNDQHGFNHSPYQPSPIRSIRSSTLDSYIGTGSNPSDSPASSFSAGRFGNSSPDPAAFGGRVGQYGVGDIGTGRVGSFGVTGEASPALPGRRNTYAESIDYRSQGLNNVLPQRGSAMDHGFGINGGGGFSSPWQAGTFDGLNGGRSSADSSGYQAAFANNSNLAMNPSLGANPSFADTAGYRTNEFGYGNQPVISGGFNRSMYNDPSIVGASTLQYNQHLPSTIPDLFDQGQPHNIHNEFPVPASQESSPWGAVDPKRTGSFDAPHSTTTNTSGWGPSHQAAPSQANEQPELDAKQTSPLTSAPPKEEEQTVQQPQEVIAIETSPPVPPAAPVHVEEPEPIQEAAPSSPKKAKRRAPTTTLSVEPPQVPASQQAVASPQPVSAPPSKAPWAKDEDVKKTTATSLRQIQDAEAKKAEARKIAEREKERASRGNATATAAAGEDHPTFTTSWGLPTSQAGRGSVTTPTVVSPAKEVPIPAAPAPAVWTAAAKAAPVKKTMKEIQEEEERRKKANAAAAAAAAKESGVTTASTRRGYAESTTKAAPPSSQSNAWTTVGPSGKAVAGATAPTPVRPTAPTAASAPSVMRVNGATSSTPRSAPQAATVAKAAPPAASKAEEFPLPPSNDFMRWLGDNMKALNSSVNVEEIMNMLLSFPLDPDSSTTEIISDLIYANSTTLDGRRFAADFVSKRKADAVARSKAAPGTSAKLISVADVVKAQPKQQSPEWGGFKVVNKKKKGGRS